MNLIVSPQCIDIYLNFNIKIKKGVINFFISLKKIKFKIFYKKYYKKLNLKNNYLIYFNFNFTLI